MKKKSKRNNAHLTVQGPGPLLSGTTEVAFHKSRVNLSTTFFPPSILLLFVHHVETELIGQPQYRPFQLVPRLENHVISRSGELGLHLK